MQPKHKEQIVKRKKKAGKGIQIKDLSKDPYKIYQQMQNQKSKQREFKQIQDLKKYFTQMFPSLDEETVIAVIIEKKTEEEVFDALLQLNAPQDQAKEQEFSDEQQGSSQIFSEKQQREREMQDFFEDYQFDQQYLIAGNKFIQNYQNAVGLTLDEQTPLGFDQEPDYIKYQTQDLPMPRKKKPFPSRQKWQGKDDYLDSLYYYNYAAVLCSMEICKTIQFDRIHDIVVKNKGANLDQIIDSIIKIRESNKILESVDLKMKMAHKNQMKNNLLEEQKNQQQKVQELVQNKNQKDIEKLIKEERKKNKIYNANQDFPQLDQGIDHNELKKQKFQATIIKKIKRKIEKEGIKLDQDHIYQRYRLLGGNYQQTYSSIIKDIEMSSSPMIKPRQLDSSSQYVYIPDDKVISKQKQEHKKVKKISNTDDIGEILFQVFWTMDRQQVKEGRGVERRNFRDNVSTKAIAQKSYNVLAQINSFLKVATWAHQNNDRESFHISMKKAKQLRPIFKQQRIEDAVQLFEYKREECVQLHGLFNNEATGVIKQILKKFEKYEGVDKPFQFKIITGAGNHSKNKVPVLFPAIQQLLNKLGYKYSTKDKAYFLVKIT